eukprot:scaffold61893_cov51-Phaeocystis_antarctica.AAC.7
MLCHRRGLVACEAVEAREGRAAAARSGEIGEVHEHGRHSLVRRQPGESPRLEAVVMQGVALAVTLGEPREHARQHEVAALVPQAQDGAGALWCAVRLRDARGGGRQRHVIQHVRALVWRQQSLNNCGRRCLLHLP